MRSRTLMFLPIAATLLGCGDKVVFPPVEAGPVDAAAERNADGPSSDTANDAVPDSSSGDSAQTDDAASNSAPDVGGE